ncbi:hypothetical protein M407DRAFT_22575 [Tulasnella calospora MUT 4182]|uniref:Major facilitator superfamily (MFS) profile domain-containing protein n=1 Tax=Tulasnella calospora MUT 4182 TaxID=1051891 RepID=A0A0C3L3D5_9AGAM|nr:hypothetical protein M407DRAFT_22575 [Tulasnella calospora MUT 4182]
MNEDTEVSGSFRPYILFPVISTNRWPSTWVKKSPRADKSEQPLTGASNDRTLEAELDAKDTATTWYVWMLVLASNISGLLFGYDTGVISGALVTIRGDLGPAKLSNMQRELITSSMTVGALLGGLAGGIISDWTGRKWALGIADVIFIAGAAVQAISDTVWQMVLASSCDKATDTRQLATSPRSAAKPPPEEIEQRVRLMEDSVQESIRITKETTFTQRFMSVFLVNEMIVACVLQGFQQLCGFNTLMYYSATLFKSIGFSKPTTVGLIISGTNFVFTLFALNFLTRKTNGVFVDGTEYPKSWSIMVLFSMVFYVGSYATGLGNVPWQQGELFALEVRGIGSSLATATNWSGNLTIGSTYLSLIRKITAAGAFGFYVGLCILGWTFCLLCYPETAGLSLEEVTQIFKDDFGIGTAERLRREKAHLRADADFYDTGAALTILFNVPRRP